MGKISKYNLNPFPFHVLIQLKHNKIAFIFSNTYSETSLKESLEHLKCGFIMVLRYFEKGFEANAI